MNKFIITTDTTADLPEQYIKENKIGLLCMPFQIDNIEYRDNKRVDIKNFYNKMRSGSIPTTSQINPQQAKMKFEEYLRQGYDVLHISFSSNLSGSYNNTKIAADELKEEYTKSKVLVIDSLSVSLGEALLVIEAVKQKKEGKSVEEIYSWLEQNKLNVCQYFTVDDLNHLFRGGRISKTTAIIGNVIGIKPIINVNNEGKLIPIGKVRGRKQSLTKLIDNMEKSLKDYETKNNFVLISHADDLEGAKNLSKKIKERLGIETLLINDIGPIIGSHCGPGTVAVFFMGKNR